VLLAALVALPALPPLVPTAAAQGVALVPPGDLAYRDVDRLVELGLVDSVIVGQRPYSRREFGRIVRMARDRLDRDAGNVSFTDRESQLLSVGSNALQRLEERFADEARDRLDAGPVISLVDGAALEFSSTNADRRGFPAPHTAPIEAQIDPLAEPRLAQPAVRGNSTFLELSQRIEPTSWLSFYSRERVEYRAPLDTTIGRVRGELLIAAARLRYRNAALSIGRQPFAWAQAEGDGLFFASDAPAIDQVSLETDAPVIMAGPLRALGPMRGTIVLSDLGPSVTRTNSKLLAYKVSALPAPWFEVGGTFMNHFGGAGGRQSSRIDQLVDFLPFVDVFRRHNYTDSTRTLDVDSDKLLGFDSRVHFARLGGMTLAGELLIDDFDIHSVQRMLTGYGSQTVHLIFPAVGTPDVTARLGAKHMGTITYSHFALPAGIASRGRLLGDELGPDAKEVSGDIAWSPDGLFRVGLEAHEQWYSNATYGFAYTDSGHVQTAYYKVSSTPDERRHLVIGTLEMRRDADFSILLRAGGQVVENYAFLGYQRTDYVASVALRLRQ